MSYETGTLGFTGTQRGMTAEQRLALSVTLSSYAHCELHHGMCIGADAEVNGIARGYGIRTVGWPGTDGYGGQPKLADCVVDEMLTPLPYLVRNRLIVEGSSLLLAAPGESVEVRRSGTRSTVRYAVSFGVPVLITFPDGSQSLRVGR